MTDWREELVEKMANAMFASDEDGTLRVDAMARAALAVVEPVIREQADDALREENARLRELLIVVTRKDCRAVRDAIPGKVKDEAACPAPDEAP